MDLLERHPLDGTRKKPTLDWDQQHREDYIPEAAGINLKPSERALYGVIATIENQDTGQLLTITAGGTGKEAVAEICERIDWLKGKWLILTLSTPVSVYRDLQGRRSLATYLPEVRMLTTAGRPELLKRTERRVQSLGVTARCVSANVTEVR